jgi:hypothetical protein
LIQIHFSLSRDGISCCFGSSCGRDPSDEALGAVSGETLSVASEARFANPSSRMLAQLEFQKLSGKSRIAGPHSAVFSKNPSQATNVYASEKPINFERETSQMA